MLLVDAPQTNNNNNNDIIMIIIKETLHGSKSSKSHWYTHGITLVEQSTRSLCLWEVTFAKKRENLL